MKTRETDAAGNEVLLSQYEVICGANYEVLRCAEYEVSRCARCENSCAQRTSLRSNDDLTALPS